MKKKNYAFKLYNSFKIDESLYRKYKNKNKHEILELENVRLRNALNEANKNGSIGFKLFYLVIGCWIISQFFW